MECMFVNDARLSVDTYNRPSILDFANALCPHDNEFAVTMLNKCKHTHIVDMEYFVGVASKISGISKRVIWKAITFKRYDVNNYAWLVYTLGIILGFSMIIALGCNYIESLLTMMVIISFVF